MNAAERLEVVNRYDQKLQELGVVPRELPPGANHPSMADWLAHLASMIPTMRKFLEGDEEAIARFNRWLGWMQGVFCVLGIYTLDEERSHNRPSR